MAYKIIAIDLDDTLLDESRKISPEDKDSIRKAQDAGVHIILASGRPYGSIVQFIKELGLKGYTIATAGGHVVDEKGEIVYSSYLPPLTAKQIMRWAALRNIHFQLYFDDGFYYLKHNRFSDAYEKNSNNTGIEDLDLLNRENILTAKIILIDDADKIKEYRHEIGAHFPEVTAKTSMPEYLEITNPETSKANALRFIAGKLNASPEQVIAIGDSEIDISMIEYAGLGAAVKCAAEPVRATADYICQSAKNGVSEVINQFIFD